MSGFNPLVNLPENGFSIIRGTSKTLELTVTDENDDAVDLTGARVVFTVKDNITDVSPLLQKTSDTVAEVEITKPREGKVHINLSPSDTQGLAAKEYSFDIWVILSSGKRYAVVPPSIMEVQQGVTLLP